MLILEIALGIVLAILILYFLPEIFGLAALLVAGALAIGGIYWLWSSGEGKELLILGLIALPVWVAGVLISEKSKVCTVGGAAIMVVTTILAGAMFVELVNGVYSDVISTIMYILLLLLPLAEFI